MELEKPGKEVIANEAAQNRAEEAEAKPKRAKHLVHGRAKDLKRFGSVAAIVITAGISLLTLWRPDIAILLQTTLRGIQGLQ